MRTILGTLKSRIMTLLTTRKMSNVQGNYGRKRTVGRSRSMYIMNTANNVDLQTALIFMTKRTGIIMHLIQEIARFHG